MERAIKAFAMAIIIAIVSALTLSALGIIAWQLFWVIAIITAIIAYCVIPAMRKRYQ